MYHQHYYHNITTGTKRSFTKDIINLPKPQVMPIYRPPKITQKEELTKGVSWSRETDTGTPPQGSSNPLVLNSESISTKEALVTKKPDDDRAGSLGPTKMKHLNDEETPMTGSVTKANAIIGKSQTKPKKKWSWLMRSIAKVLTTPTRRMDDSKFVFTNTKEAADHNSKILKRHR